MAKTILGGSKAIAETVRLCKPAVISAYPITPNTKIVAELAQLVADGDIISKYMEVESEFSALSSLIGASATGGRTFTATCSQGLALMHEVLFAAAGMRLPIVMVVTNRALSAPINIWNDHQDSISERDSGWIQFYVETVQEAVDTLVQAYKIAEKELLPVMVNMDGFYLTHVVEPVELLTQEKVDKFLPKYKPAAILNPKKPMTLGPFTYPLEYMTIRKEISNDILNSFGTIRETQIEFEKGFGRRYGLIEEYKNDKKITVVAMGSVCGTIKEAIDKNANFGLLRIRCFRPFPKKEIEVALKGKEIVIVLDRNISLGNAGALFIELKDLTDAKVVDWIVGLGGVDIPLKDIERIIKESEKKKDGEISWQI